MLASQTPTLVPLAFAANGTKNTIPEASQIGVTPGAASLNDGFPPLTFTPIAAGGVPPAGADFNGVLNLITQSIRWAHGGGLYAFSSTFAADANVGGYPQGAELMSADAQGTWISLNDSNTDNPDTGAGTKWVPGRAYGITAITGLANANVTLTPAQAAKNKITFAGTLTGNVQANFPTWLRDWTVVNNTTGAFTLTCKTASGTGIVIPQDGSPTKIVGDGTNITHPAENVAAATQSTHPVQLGQFETIAQYSVTQTGTLGNPISATTYTPTSQTITFPSFSKTGAFRVVAQLVSSGFSTTAGVGGQFTNQLYDGSVVAASGGAWPVYKKNTGYGWQVGDTLISSTTYAPGSTVTFTQRVVIPVLEDTQFSIQNCFMRISVIEA